MMTQGRGVVRTVTAACAAILVAGAWGPVHGQAGHADVIEVPLRVEAGRLMVTAEGRDGATYDFVLGLATPILTESGAARLGAARTGLTLGGAQVQLEGAAEVPDTYLADVDAVGVLGGPTLNRYDIVIDVPNERLLMKPSARSVRWSGIALSGPVAVQVYHDYLIRADVEFGGTLVGGLIDLTKPGFEVNDALAGGITDGTAAFRMGYGSWSALPADVVDSPVFRGWDPDGNGFAIVGASIAYDCAIAISWYHREVRTCTR